MIRILFTVYFLLVIHIGFALGYDDRTAHPQITEKAIRNASNLNTYMKTSLGFEKGFNSRFPSNSQDPRTSALELLKKGSTDEDAEACRRANHMHNPLRPWDISYMSDAPWWTQGCYPLWDQRYSNITWATGFLSPPPEDQKATFTNRPAYAPRNWDTARTLYYNALVANLSVTRESLFSSAFKTIGQVMHLLQDMAVPAHTRNDFASHLIGTGWVWDTGRYQPYEYYVQTHSGLITGASPVNLSFADIKLTNYWDTDKYNGSNPSTLLDIGLAEFSNANYFSDYTIPANNPTPEHQFPYPYISSSNISGPSYQVCLNEVAPGVVVKYISRKNGTPCPVQTDTASIDHFAVVGLLSGYPDPNTTSYMWLDDNVHKTYANELLPRAVGYSAGLLDYFFRGDLEVISASNGIKIKNINQEAMDSYTDSTGSRIGNIEIYYDDVSKTRHLLATYELTSSLSPDQETPVIPFTAPSDNIKAGKYIIVFRGKLGSEDGAVIGKVVNTMDYIYYTSTRNGIEKIYRMATDGSNPTVVYDNQDPNLYVRGAKPSPDGKTLAFVVYESAEDITGAIYLMDLTTGAVNALTSGDSFDWSPDGKKIVFERKGGECLPYYADDEIFIHDLTTAIETQITERSCSPSVHPIWSPDGSMIAYSRWQDAGERNGSCSNFAVIYLMSPSGNPIGPITCGNDGYEDFVPSWSPDGSEIIFIRKAFTPPQNYYQLYKVNILTGAITKLTDSNGTNFDESVPAWSPDGKTIAIGSSRDGDYDIWLVDPNAGGYKTNLTDANPEYDIQPSFSK